MSTPIKLPVGTQTKKIDKIYQLIDLVTKAEYYTYSAPLLDSENLIFEKVVVKKSVKETVLNDNIIEEFYCSNVEAAYDGTTINHFSLSSGFILKSIDLETEDLNWLKVTELEAKEKLKDKALIYYQTVVPKLLQDFNKLQTIVQELKNERDENNDFIPPQRRQRDLTLK